MNISDHVFPTLKLIGENETDLANLERTRQEFLEIYNIESGIISFLKSEDGASKFGAMVIVLYDYGKEERDRLERREVCGPL
ncbi:hypothetical protein HY967_04705 [Candidatus Jorgensenbacteria bacterium]|nr:hypothetical protein [Candidatus Jorgensenbacteria bacterium]